VYHDFSLKENTTPAIELSKLLYQAIGLKEDPTKEMWIEYFLGDLIPFENDDFMKDAKMGIEDFMAILVEELDNNKARLYEESQKDVSYKTDVQVGLTIATRLVDSGIVSASKIYKRLMMNEMTKSMLSNSYQLDEYLFIKQALNKIFDVCSNFVTSLYPDNNVSLKSIQRGNEIVPLNQEEFDQNNQRIRFNNEIMSKINSKLGESHSLIRQNYKFIAESLINFKKSLGILLHNEIDLLTETAKTLKADKGRMVGYRAYDLAEKMFRIKKSMSENGLPVDSFNLIASIYSRQVNNEESSDDFKLVILPIIVSRYIQAYYEEVESENKESLVVQKLRDLIAHKVKKNFDFDFTNSFVRKINLVKNFELEDNSNQSILRLIYLLMETLDSQPYANEVNQLIIKNAGKILSFDSNIVQNLVHFNILFKDDFIRFNLNPQFYSVLFDEVIGFLSFTNKRIEPENLSQLFSEFLDTDFDQNEDVKSNYWPLKLFALNILKGNSFNINFKTLTDENTIESNSLTLAKPENKLFVTAVRNSYPKYNGDRPKIQKKAGEISILDILRFFNGISTSSELFFAFKSGVKKQEQRMI